MVLLERMVLVLIMNLKMAAHYEKPLLQQVPVHGMLMNGLLIMTVVATIKFYRKELFKMGKSIIEHGFDQIFGSGSDNNSDSGNDNDDDEP